MMLADLPPNSSATRLTESAANSATRLPARVEPVKLTMSTSGWLANTSPTTGPKPFTRLNTPAGRPASWMISAKIMALTGAISLGFKTTVQPAASAGAIFNVIWFKGKFQGVMQPTTPIGSRTTSEWPTFSSYTKARATLAALPQLKTGPPTCTILASLIGMPTSRAMAVAISSERAFKPATILSMKTQRSSTLKPDQAGNAARAAKTACAASSAVPCGTVAITSSVLASCTSKTAVAWALCQAPLM